MVLSWKALGDVYRYWIGRLIFSAGWALAGACPGPLFALCEPYAVGTWP
jgi:hypothetical protein